jgi:membrane protease YdiL (CAAX protease family)
LSPDLFAILSKQFGPPKFEYGFYPVIFLIDQIATTVLVLVAAGMHGGSRSAVLRLGPAKGGFLTSVMLASSAYIIIRFIEAALPIHVQGIQQAPVIQPAWWLPWIILTVWIIGAPISEELLFRGFLLSALAKSRAGFWGAAVISNIAWTFTHSWNWDLILTVFVFGLLLSFILSRTGSIWPCVLAHAMGNVIPALGVMLSVR